LFFNVGYKNGFVLFSLGYFLRVWRYFTMLNLMPDLSLIKNPAGNKHSNDKLVTIFWI